MDTSDLSIIAYDPTAASEIIEAVNRGGLNWEESDGMV
jgi:hypothetical protein